MVILLAHGAVPPRASVDARMEKMLATIAPTVSFDYPYMRDGGGRRTRFPSSWRRIAKNSPGAPRAPGPAVLAGKSMGSRIGCHVALEGRTSGRSCASATRSRRPVSARRYVTRCFSP